MSTGPSETRKLPELPKGAYLWPVSKDNDIELFSANQMRAYALEALAASEPVERRAPVQGYSPGIPWELHLEAYDAYCKRYSKQQALIEGGCRGGFHTSELDEFIPGWRDRVTEYGAMKRRIAELTEQLAAHPAPEQPGKGDVSEGEMRAAASRLTASDETNRTADSFIAAYQTQQPPDPAEGDALRALIADWRERAKNGPGALNVAAKELEAALSTPTTAAVRVDMGDLLFVGFDKNSEHRLFRMRKTAERHCIGDIKTYAALDAQVKPLPGKDQYVDHPVAPEARAGDCDALILPDRKEDDLDPEGFGNGWNCALDAVRRLTTKATP